MVLDSSEGKGKGISCHHIKKGEGCQAIEGLDTAANASHWRVGMGGT